MTIVLDRFTCLALSQVSSKAGLFLLTGPAAYKLLSGYSRTPDQVSEATPGDINPGTRLVPPTKG